MAAGFIVVMLALHFLPRFQKAPQVSNHLTMLTGEQPALLQQFIQQNKNRWL